MTSTGATSLVNTFPTALSVVSSTYKSTEIGTGAGCNFGRALRFCAAFGAVKHKLVKTVRAVLHLVRDHSKTALFLIALSKYCCQTFRLVGFPFITVSSVYSYNLYESKAESIPKGLKEPCQAK